MIEKSGMIWRTLPKPYMPRALQAPDLEHPHGTPGHRHNEMSFLQQHVAIFDQNGNGIIYPGETFIGLREIGFNAIASFIMTVLIHGAMSYATLPLDDSSVDQVSDVLEQFFAVGCFM